MMKIRGEKAIVLQLISSSRSSSYCNDVYKIVIVGPQESIKSVIAGLACGSFYIIEEPETKNEFTLNKIYDEKVVIKKWKIENYYIGLFYHPNITKNIIKIGNYIKLYNLLRKKKIPVSLKWIPKIWDYLIVEELLTPVEFYEHNSQNNKSQYYQLHLNSISQLEDFFLANIDWLEKKAMEELKEIEFKKM